MRTRLTIKFHSLLERYFPERRVFLKSDKDTRYIRLSSETQIVAVAGVAVMVGWTAIATAVLLMDSIGSGNFREQAKRDQATYQERLNILSVERDARAAEALAAQDRFNAALAQISAMQSELLASENRRRELETGIEVIQTTLRATMKQREVARNELAAMQQETDGSDMYLDAIANPAQMEFMTEALSKTAEQRDQIAADAQQALDQRDELELEIRLMQERSDEIFRQLEEAMVISVEPLDKMFRQAGMPTDRIIEEVRRGYSGMGGPLNPISFSSRGEQEPSADEARANTLLQQMDQLNLYRIAAEKAPFAAPTRSAVRMTSGFGYRRDPFSGGRRMHSGVDFAGSHGTDIFATADGVVVFEGWKSGYGRVVKIRHAFGIETVYAHNTKNRVKKGQRVSRGDHIADMGSTGRSTGTHLHYEVRVNGKPVNPMTYIKAARNVF
ncbi:MAG: M23 family metallopeptidase [Pseudomonadota bacterium]